MKVTNVNVTLLYCEVSGIHSLKKYEHLFGKVIVFAEIHIK